MTDEQAKQLAEIQAKRDRLAETRATTFATDPVAQAVKALAEEEAVFALEQKHGKRGVGIALTRCLDGSLLVAQRPHPATYQKYYDTEPKTLFAMRSFLLPCVVYPADKDVAGKLIDGFPVAADMLAADLLKLLGPDPKG